LHSARFGKITELQSSFFKSAFSGRTPARISVAREMGSIPVLNAP
jgi:hypothetical protein